MRVSILLLIICCCFLCPVSVDATNLRGRVDGIGPYASAPFPLAKARVELKRQVNKAAIMSYQTGRDGMYYFRNIQPGQYVLVVNSRLTVPIRVRSTSLQDIGPLLFRH